MAGFMTRIDPYEASMKMMQERGGAFRLKAAALVPTLPALFPAKLAEFQKAHDDDVADYAFECKRHGDFLAVFMQRGPQLPAKQLKHAVPREQKLAHAISLSATKTIGIVRGAAPGLSGKLHFRVVGEDEVEPSWATPNRYFSMVHVAVESSGDAKHYVGMTMGHTDYFQGMHLPDAPEAARDDEIKFNGCGVTVYAPAGVGQQVYDAILREIGDGFLNPSA